MTDHAPGDDRAERDDGVESPRRYWVGIVIVVLAILLVIGMSLVLFVASDPPTSSIEPMGRTQATFWLDTYAE